MTKLPKICLLQGILKLSSPERRECNTRRSGGQEVLPQVRCGHKKGGKKCFPLLKLGVSDWDTNPINVRLQLLGEVMHVYIVLCLRCPLVSLAMC